MSVRCPVDRRSLTVKAVGRASFAICNECSGVWLTREALEPRSIDPSALPEQSRRPREPSRRARRARVCPECAQALQSERIEGVEIDRCVHCSGVWLDAGEYDAVRQRIEFQLSGPVEPQSAQASDQQKGILDIGVEAVLGLLEIFF